MLSESPSPVHDAKWNVTNVGTSRLARGPGHAQGSGRPVPKGAFMDKSQVTDPISPNPDRRRSLRSIGGAIRLMRRLLPAVGAVWLLSLTIPASGLPGFDHANVPRSFTIVVESRNPEIGPSAHKVYDMLDFTRSTPGWDFGDREAYRCAFVEYFGAGGNLLFAINFERIRTPEIVANPYAVMLNDRGGMERSDPQGSGRRSRGSRGPLTPIGSDDLCGSGRGLSVPFDGTDHFPHGTMLEFTRNGNPLVDLHLHRNHCAKGYWTPGDEPGEAWLWWDEDGPTNDGHGDLNCSGGPGEPRAVVRAWVERLAPSVAVCTEDSLDGDWC